MSDTIEVIAIEALLKTGLERWFATGFFLRPTSDVGWHDFQMLLFGYLDSAIVPKLLQFGKPFRLELEGQIYTAKGLEGRKVQQLVSAYNEIDGNPFCFEPITVDRWALNVGRDE